MTHLGNYLQSTQPDFFIEIEGKQNVIQNYLTNNNIHRNGNEGIIVLDDDANKWGLEARVYFHHDNNIPVNLQNEVKPVPTYKTQYNCRINNNDLVTDLLTVDGFSLGLN